MYPRCGSGLPTIRREAGTRHRRMEKACAATAARDCRHLARGCGMTNLAAVSVASGFQTLKCPIASFVPWARPLGRHLDAERAPLCCLSRLRNAPLVDNGCAAGIDRPRRRSVGTPALGPCRALGGKLVPVLLSWRHFHMGARVVRFLPPHPRPYQLGQGGSAVSNAPHAYKRENN